MNLNTQIICVALAVLSMTGCVSRKKVVKDTFMIQVMRGDAPVSSASEAVLDIQPFSIAPAFQNMGLASRTSENQYASDFYNEYFVSPSSMITNESRNWLHSSGLFAQVLPLYSSVVPTHTLEGHISEMYMDVRDDADPKAILEITFFLIEQHKREGVVRFQKTYRSVQSMERVSAKEYAASQSIGLREIFGKLEKDLAAQL